MTLSGGALFATWNLFQFQSSVIVKVILANLSGFGPTCCLLSESHLVTVLVASPEGAYGGSQFFNQAWRSLSDFAKDLPHGLLELTKPALLLLSVMILGPRYRTHHSVHLTTRQSFAYFYRLPCMGRITVTSRICAEPFGSNFQTYGVVLTLINKAGKTWQKTDRLRRKRETLDATKKNFKAHWGKWLNLPG